jgi:ATPase subunit of ABC transporter with duplicated ATPase domains
LVSGVNVRINHGDRIGFVGRNGAGKSTLAKALAGENLPAGGAVQRTGKIGYLPKIRVLVKIKEQPLIEFSLLET